MPQGQGSFNVSANLVLNPQSLVQASRQAKQALGRITGQASEFQKSLDASTARVFAFGATTSVLTGVASAFKALVASTISVEKRLVEINSILNASASDFADFRNTIFSVAKSTGQSFDIVADAAAELARQGLSAAETAKRLEAALILTRVSGLDSVKSVNALTAAINGYTSAGLTAEQITNKLVAVDTNFAVSAKDLAEALSRAGSTAEDAGVSFDELLGIVTAVQQTTSRGGAVIGNALKSIFTRLGRGKTIDSLQALGVAIDASQSGVQKLQALASALSQISDPTQANAIKELAGGVYQINLVSAALKDLQSQSSIFSQATAISSKATNEALIKNEQLNQSIAAQINTLVAGVTNLAEKIGQLTFAPVLKSLLSLTNKFVGWLDTALDPEKGNKFIQALFKTIGSFLGGPAIVLVTAAFLKIFTLVARYAKEGFKTVLNIGTQTERIKNLEAGIKTFLDKNAKLHELISNSTLTEAQKHQLILDVIKQENRELAKQQQLLTSLANFAYSKGVRGFNEDLSAYGKGGKKISAAGFIPNFANGQMLENIGAQQHGYKAGKARQIRIHDGNGKSFNSFVNDREKIFNFTNSKGNRATIVRPPNGFGAGTQVAGMASGFIPNFANFEGWSRAALDAVLNGLRKSPRELQAKLSGARTTPAELQAIQFLLKAMGSGTFNKNEIKQEVEALIRKPREVAKEFVTPQSLNQGDSLRLILGKIGAKSIDDLAKYKNAGLDSYNLSSLGGSSKVYRSVLDSYFSRNAQARFENQAKEEKNRLENFIDEYTVSANSIGGIGLISPRFGGQGRTFAKMPLYGINSLYKLKGADGTPFLGKKDEKAIFNKKSTMTISDITTSGVPSGQDVVDISKNINEFFAGPLVNLADSMYGQLFDVSNRSEFQNDLAKFKATSAGGILSPSAEGAIFESASKIALSSMKEMKSIFDPTDTNRPFDFSNSAALKKILGINVLKGEAKRLGEKQITGQTNGLVIKAFNDPDYSPKLIKQMYEQYLSSPNRVLEKTKKAASGFIPNFVGKSSLIGEGFFGKFHKLNDTLGVKRFKKNRYKNPDALSEAIAEEFAISKILAEEPLVSGVDAPDVVDTLQRALQAKSVRKKIISDPVAIKAIGGHESNQLGDVISNLLDNAGMQAEDLHGNNFTVNQAAEEYIRKNDDWLTLKSSFERTYAGNKNYLQDIAQAGGKINILDAGYMRPMTEHLFNLYKKYSTLPASQAAGFIPNYSKALKDAVKREISAGVDPSKVYIDQHSSLRSSRNPSGLMVANTIDEPKGGIQGINRARKEGRNPKMYGAAKGFIPNYAKKRYGKKENKISDTSQITTPLLPQIKENALIALPKEINDMIRNAHNFNVASLEASKDLQKLNKELSPEKTPFSKKISKLKEKTSLFTEAYSESSLKRDQGQGFLGKIQSHTGKIQGSLLSLSLGANMLGDSMPELSDTITKATTALSILDLSSGLFGPLVSGIKGLSAAIGGATVGIFAITAAAAGVSAYLFNKETSRLVDAQEKNIAGIEEETRVRAQKLTLSRTAKEAGVTDLTGLYRQTRGTKIGNQINSLQDQLKQAYKANDYDKIEEVRQKLLEAFREAAKETNIYNIQLKELKDSSLLLADTFIAQSDKISTAIGKIVSKLENQALANKVASNVPLRDEAKYGDRLSNLLKIQSNKNQALQANAGFLQSFFQKAKFDEAGKLTSGGIFDLIKQRLETDQAFGLTSPTGYNKQQDISNQITSGKFLKDSFKSFMEGGTDALKSKLEEAIGPIKDNEAGQQFLDSVKEAALNFRDQTIEAYQSVKNTQLEIINKLIDSISELKNAQNESLRTLPSKVSEIKSGESVDPLFLFKKFQEAAKLLNSSDLSTRAQGTNILGSISGGTDIFKKLFGDKALTSLQVSAGLKPSDVSKAVGSATMDRTNFAMIKNSIKEMFGGNEFFRASQALDKAKQDPTKINDLINIIKSSLTTRNAEKGKALINTLTSISQASFENEEVEKIKKSQNELASKLQETTIEVEKFRTLMKDTGIPDSIDSLSKSVFEASENLKDFNSFTKSLSNLSLSVTSRLDELTQRVNKLSS